MQNTVYGMQFFGLRMEGKENRCFIQFYHLCEKKHKKNKPETRLVPQ